MAFTPAEAASLALDLADLVAFITKALKEDEKGQKTIDKAEVKELQKKLKALAIKTAIDIVD
jgi:hypothetical protein